MIRMKAPRTAPVRILDFGDDAIAFLLDGRQDAIRPFPFDYTAL
jgi:hypothetical protein